MLVAQKRSFTAIVVHEWLLLLGPEDRRMDVAAWLRCLGLERYDQAFRDNEIDEKVLSGLTAEDLKDLGVTLVGHRRRLLDAVAVLGAAVATAAASVTVGAARPGTPV
jgi:hypothetical protein